MCETRIISIFIACSSILACPIADINVGPRVAQLLTLIQMGNDQTQIPSYWEGRPAHLSTQPLHASSGRRGVRGGSHY